MRGSAAMRVRPGWRGYGGVASVGLAPGTPLLDFADVVFGRATEGSYVNSVSSVDWYAIDVIRTGAKGMLCERSRIHYLARPIWLEAAWSALNNSSTLTGGSASAGTAPDGTTAARGNLHAGTTSQLTQGISNSIIADSIPITIQAWLRGTVGGETLKSRFVTKAAANQDVTLSALTTSWSVFKQTVTDIGVAGSGPVVRLLNTSAGAAQVFDVWGYSVMGGRYAVTPIRVPTAPATSQPDQAQWLSASVPLALREGKIEIVATPYWSAADLVSGDERWLLGWPLSYGYRVRHNGTDVRAEIVEAGTVRAQSGAIAGSTQEVQRTFYFDPVAAIVKVDGVAGSAGTPCTMPGGAQVRLAGDLGVVDHEFDGYVNVPTVAA